MPQIKGPSTPLCVIAGFEQPLRIGYARAVAPA